MKRNEVGDKLREKGFLEHDVVDVMLLIPPSEGEIDRLKLTQILVKAQFPTHEITHVCTALFS
jgi:hypothetical protein